MTMPPAAEVIPPEAVKAIRVHLLDGLKSAQRHQTAGRTAGGGTSGLECSSSRSDSRVCEGCTMVSDGIWPKRSTRGGGRCSLVLDPRGVLLSPMRPRQETRVLA